MLQEEVEETGVTGGMADVQSGDRKSRSGSRRKGQKEKLVELAARKCTAGTDTRIKNG